MVPTEYIDNELGDYNKYPKATGEEKKRRKRGK